MTAPTRPSTPTAPEIIPTDGHRPRSGRRTLAAIAAVLLGLPPVATAQYRWTDERGVTHEVRTLDEVPPAHRKDASRSPWTRSAAVREARLSGNGSQILVEGRLNGRVTGLFLLDTGASYCVITPETARRLGISSRSGSSTVTLVTANGEIQAPLTHLREVEVARAHVGDVPTVIHSAVSPPLAGIIGLSFLRNFEFSIDSSKHVLRLRPQ
jgi:clan AA aspartic protease (TIGR02281 family)